MQTYGNGYQPLKRVASAPLKRDRNYSNLNIEELVERAQEYLGPFGRRIANYGAIPEEQEDFIEWLNQVYDSVRLPDDVILSLEERRAAGVFLDGEETTLIHREFYRERIREDDPEWYFTGKNKVFQRPITGEPWMCGWACNLDDSSKTHWLEARSGHGLEDGEDAYLLKTPSAAAVRLNVFSKNVGGGSSSTGVPVYRENSSDNPYNFEMYKADEPFLLKVEYDETTGASFQLKRHGGFMDDGNFISGRGNDISEPTHIGWRGSGGYWGHDIWMGGDGSYFNHRSSSNGGSTKNAMVVIDKKEDGSWGIHRENNNQGMLSYSSRCTGGCFPEISFNFPYDGAALEDSYETLTIPSGESLIGTHEWDDGTRYTISEIPNISQNTVAKHFYTGDFEESISVTITGSSETPVFVEDESSLKDYAPDPQFSDDFKSTILGHEGAFTFSSSNSSMSYIETYYGPNSSSTWNRGIKYDLSPNGGDTEVHLTSMEDGFWLLQIDGGVMSTGGSYRGWISQNHRIFHWSELSEEGELDMYVGATMKSFGGEAPMNSWFFSDKYQKYIPRLHTEVTLKFDLGAIKRSSGIFDDSSGSGSSGSGSSTTVPSELPKFSEKVEDYINDENSEAFGRDWEGSGNDKIFRQYVEQLDLSETGDYREIIKFQGESEILNYDFLDGFEFFTRDTDFKENGGNHLLCGEIGSGKSIKFFKNIYDGMLTYDSIDAKGNMVLKLGSENAIKINYESNFSDTFVINLDDANTFGLSQISIDSDSYSKSDTKEYNGGIITLKTPWDIPTFQHGFKSVDGETCGQEGGFCPHQVIPTFPTVCFTWEDENYFAIGQIEIPTFFYSYTKDAGKISTSIPRQEPEGLDKVSESFENGKDKFTYNVTYKKFAEPISIPTRKM